MKCIDRYLNTFINLQYLLRKASPQETILVYIHYFYQNISYIKTQNNKPLGQSTLILHKIILCSIPASGYTSENSRFFKRAISAIQIIPNVTYTNRLKLVLILHKSIQRKLQAVSRQMIPHFYIYAYSKLNKSYVLCVCHLHL